MSYIQTFNKQAPSVDRVLSYSSLKAFSKSPIDFIKYINKDFVTSDSMILGNLVDTLLLSKENFEKEYLIIPKLDKRKKAEKEQFLLLSEKAEKENKICINHEVYDKAIFMVERLKSNPLSQYLLNNTTQTQKEINFKYKGRNLKGFVDGVGNIEGQNFIFDLKTTNKDLDNKSWIREIINYQYHLQASIYTRGSMNESINTDFYHIIVENKEPYNVLVVKFSKEMIKTGYNILNKLLDDYKYCEDLKLWHQGKEFYTPKIEEIDLPEWYLKSIENE